MSNTHMIIDITRDLKTTNEPFLVIPGCIFGQKRGVPPIFLGRSKCKRENEID
jgi:hypothetical protein